MAEGLILKSGNTEVRLSDRAGETGELPACETISLGDVNYQPSSSYLIESLHAGQIKSVFLTSTGGASGIHASSAVIVNETIFVAIGDQVCALNLPDLAVQWTVQADEATCFGVYNHDPSRSLISHGELLIARLTYEGRVLWAQSGRDIFSEGIEIFDDHVVATDFNGDRYRFEIGSGTSTMMPR